MRAWPVEHNGDPSRARATEAAHRINASADAHEGATAFVEKRAPRWTGR